MKPPWPKTKCVRKGCSRPCVEHVALRCPDGLGRFTRLAASRPRRGPAPTSEFARLVGEHVRAARRGAGLTQEQLGRALGGKPGTTIAQIENGRFLPRLSTLIDIAEACGVPPENLVGAIARARRARRQAGEGAAA